MALATDTVTGVDLRTLALQAWDQQKSATQDADRERAAEDHRKRRDHLQNWIDGTAGKGRARVYDLPFEVYDLPFEAGGVLLDVIWRDGNMKVVVLGACPDCTKIVESDPLWFDLAALGQQLDHFTPGWRHRQECTARQPAPTESNAERLAAVLADVLRPYYEAARQ